MKKNIEVRIANNGVQAGTIGWLANQSIEIIIGITKNERARAAWLKVGEKSELVAVDGYECNFGDLIPAEGVCGAKVERYDGYFQTHAFGVALTDAAWAAVEGLIATARDVFAKQVLIEAQAEAQVSLIFNVNAAKS